MSAPEGLPFGKCLNAVRLDIKTPIFSPIFRLDARWTVECCMRSGVSFRVRLGWSGLVRPGAAVWSKSGRLARCKFAAPNGSSNLPLQTVYGKTTQFMSFFWGGRCVDLGIWFPKIGCEGVGGWAESLLKPHEQKHVATVQQSMKHLNLGLRCQPPFGLMPII